MSEQSEMFRIEMKAEIEKTKKLMRWIPIETTLVVWIAMAYITCIVCAVVAIVIAVV